jgi:transcriptional regulator with XRE-family HTH domain
MKNIHPLRKAMTKNGLTYQKVSDLTGVHRQYIFQICAGKRQPSPKLAYKLIEVTGKTLTLADFFPPQMVADFAEELRKAG